MDLTLSQYAVGVLCGSLVGFSLGLTGGGGSLLAVPLTVYVVGLPDPHRAIGTTAMAVAGSAAINLAMHARSGMVKWSCAWAFATAGVTGAFLGSLLGKAIDGQKLLLLFALLMQAAAVLMFYRRHGIGDPTVRLRRGNAIKLICVGFFTGALSGFFGIGGGFLIVPGLILATGMSAINAVGTSLVSVVAFSATTAASYAFSGWVDVRLALALLAGGILGGLAGARLAHSLAAQRGALHVVFAVVMTIVAVYMLYRSVALAVPTHLA